MRSSISRRSVDQVVPRKSAKFPVLNGSTSAHFTNYASDISAIRRVAIPLSTPAFPNSRLYNGPWTEVGLVRISGLDEKARCQGTILNAIAAYGG